MQRNDFGGRQRIKSLVELVQSDRREKESCRKAAIAVLASNCRSSMQEIIQSNDPQKQLENLSICHLFTKVIMV